MKKLLYSLLIGFLCFTEKTDAQVSITHATTIVAKRMEDGTIWFIYKYDAESATNQSSTGLYAHTVGKQDSVAIVNVASSVPVSTALNVYNTGHPTSFGGYAKRKVLNKKWLGLTGYDITDAKTAYWNEGKIDFLPYTYADDSFSMNVFVIGVLFLIFCVLTPLKISNSETDYSLMCTTLIVPIVFYVFNNLWKVYGNFPQTGRLWFTSIFQHVCIVCIPFLGVIIKDCLAKIQKFLLAEEKPERAWLLDLLRYNYHIREKVTVILCSFLFMWAYTKSVQISFGWLVVGIVLRAGIELIRRIPAGVQFLKTA